MKKVINLYKPLGMSPLDAVKKFKEFNKEYRDLKIGYAGRLDPMAEGVLILLVGEENKKINEYMNLDKEYSASILLDFSSDSNDLLGIGERIENFKGDFDEKLLKKVLREFKGEYVQKLPFYSSYRIKGKPLFYYARLGRLDEIKDIKKKVFIKNIKFKRLRKIRGSILLKYINKNIKLVKGDFRQDKILEKWENILDDNNYSIVDIIVNCSSGTYIRSIAEDFGKRMQSKGLLFSLTRRKVGRFMSNYSLRIK